MGWIIILLLCLPFASPKLFIALIMALLATYVIFSALSGGFLSAIIVFLVLVFIGGLS